jgi:hypothetical protein
MMIRKGVIKNGIAVLFIGFLFIGFMKSGSYGELHELSNFLMQDEKQLESANALTMDALETDFVSRIWNNEEFINLNGTMAKRLNMQGYYSDIGIYVMDNHYIVSAYPYTTTDYEYEQTISFKNFLDENGINLIYVNEPTKYVDDAVFRSEFGIDTFTNRNMDLFLSRIRNEGVNTIDLRDHIKAQQLNVEDLFYRTDHHWTTKAGLWACEIIAEGLNQYCDYDIDTSLFDGENFIMREWEDCWLGEQGYKLAETYVGLDDYTAIAPNFQTNYTFKMPQGPVDGTFDNFVREDVYQTEVSMSSYQSWHYSYNHLNSINNDVNHGKVLVLFDSFGRVVVPFLSLAVHELDSLSLRDYDDTFDVRQYILDNQYDTVLICYTQVMLGARDDTTSSNYRLFQFNHS